MGDVGKQKMARHVLWLTVMTLSQFCSVNSQRKDYTGYKLVSVQATTKVQREFLSDLQTESWLELDFWSKPCLYRSTSIMVPPSKYDQLITRLKSVDLHPIIQVDNMQRQIDQAARTGPNQASTLRERIYEEFLDFNEIMEFLNTTASEFPTRVTVSTIGSTFEDRPIKLVKISTNNGEPKKEVWVEVGTHAREWGAVASGLILIDKLASGYNDTMLESLDWYIIPVHNPDGYQYSHTTNRLWRKNRRSRLLCDSGVDLNRNWLTGFGGSGSSSFCDSNIYRGPFPFSEPETRSLNRAISGSASAGNVAAFFAVHTYGQLILTPYALNRRRDPPNLNQLIEVGESMDSAIQEVDGMSFEVGQSWEVLYEAGGISCDHMYIRQKIKLSYTLELRPDTNSPGFLLPASEIPLTGEELFAAMRRFSEIYTRFI